MSAVSRKFRQPSAFLSCHSPLPNQIREEGRIPFGSIFGEVPRHLANSSCSWNDAQIEMRMIKRMSLVGVTTLATACRETRSIHADGSVSSQTYRQVVLLDPVLDEWSTLCIAHSKPQALRGHMIYKFRHYSSFQSGISDSHRRCLGTHQERHSPILRVHPK